MGVKRVTDSTDQLRANMSRFGIEIGEAQICIIEGSPSKHDALDVLIHAVGQHSAITDCEAFSKAIFERESVMSTGIGDGIAIPHVRIPEVKRATLGVAVAPEGIEFDSLDNKPVHVMVLFATPEGSDKEYLGLLAQVMLALRNTELYEELLGCEAADEVHGLLGA